MIQWGLRVPVAKPAAEASRKEVNSRRWRKSLLFSCGGLCCGGLLSSSSSSSKFEGMRE